MRNPIWSDFSQTKVWKSRGKKGKLRKGKVDPNAVTGGKIRETKGELYLKAVYKKPKADKRG